MKNNNKRFFPLLGISVGFIMQMNTAFADDNSSLTAQWWQWANSIPASVNPVQDSTGKNCMVGQRGDTWFMTGYFRNDGAGNPAPVGFPPPLEINCSIPEGKSLFFPIVNSMYFNSPNVCGDIDRSVEYMRNYTNTQIGLVNKQSISVKVDNKSVDYSRIKSKVFEVTLPEENIWDQACASAGGVPAGVYSAAVDEGYYVSLNKLKVGAHTIKFSVTDDVGDFRDVTYNLTIVPVRKN